MLVAVMAMTLLAIRTVGALSDGVGRKPLLLTPAIVYNVRSVPAIMLLGVESLIMQFLGLAVLDFLLVILVPSVSCLRCSRRRSATWVCPGMELLYGVLCRSVTDHRQPAERDDRESTGEILAAMAYTIPVEPTRLLPAHLRDGWKPVLAMMSGVKTRWVNFMVFIGGRQCSVEWAPCLCCDRWLGDGRNQRPVHPVRGGRLAAGDQRSGAAGGGHIRVCAAGEECAAGFLE